MFIKTKKKETLLFIGSGEPRHRRKGIFRTSEARGATWAMVIMRWHNIQNESNGDYDIICTRALGLAAVFAAVVFAWSPSAADF